MAGNLAKLPNSELNTLATEYISLRIIYTALYMATARSELVSWLRTGVWGLSVAVPVWGLLRAGNAMDDKGGL